MHIQQETSNLQSNRRPSGAYTHFEADLHMRLLGLLALQPFAYCLPGPLVMQKQGMILLRR